jgi:hypothetical protein
MDFEGGADITLECPIKSHREKSRAEYHIPVDCDTWPKCKVCGRALKEAK